MGDTWASKSANPTSARLPPQHSKRKREKLKVASFSGTPAQEVELRLHESETTGQSSELIVKRTPGNAKQGDYFNKLELA